MILNSIDLTFPFIVVTDSAAPLDSISIPALIGTSNLFDVAMTYLLKKL